MARASHAVGLLVVAAVVAAGDLAAVQNPAVDRLVAERRLQEAAWEARVAGDTARAERLLAAIDSTLRATPRLATPLDLDAQGVSYSILVIHDDGIASLFKVDGSDVFCPECGADREVAAYRIDRLLGVDLTPVTVATRLVHEGDTLAGSAMYWIRDARDPADVGAAKPDRLRFFDAVIGNSDRHPRNWLLTPEGRPVAIDHNRAFEYQPATPTWTCWEAEVDSIASPAALGPPYRRYRSLPADSLRAALRGVTGDDHIRRFVAMRDRVVTRIEARAAEPGRALPRADCPDGP